MPQSKPINTYRQQLRDRILDTAMTAFARQGLRAVKMDDIAQQLSISKRTLYELYENKESLLYEGVMRDRARKEKDIRKMVANSSSVLDVVVYVFKKNTEELRHVSPHFFKDIVKYPRIMKMLEEDKQKNRITFINFMKRGVKEGVFLPNLNYEIVATLFDNIGATIMQHQLYMRYSMEDMLRSFTYALLRGMCTMKGVQQLDEQKIYEQ